MVVSAALIKIMQQQRDGCTICNGQKGGVKGNENVINGELVCDYCHAELIGNQQTEWE